MDGGPELTMINAHFSRSQDLVAALNVGGPSPVSAFSTVSNGPAGWLGSAPFPAPGLRMRVEMPDRIAVLATRSTKSASTARGSIAIEFAPVIAEFGRQGVVS